MVYTLRAPGWVAIQRVDADAGGAQVGPQRELPAALVSDVPTPFSRSSVIFPLPASFQTFHALLANLDQCRIDPQVESI